MAGRLFRLLLLDVNVEEVKELGGGRVLLLKGSETPFDVQHTHPSYATGRRVLPRLAVYIAHRLHAYLWTMQRLAILFLQPCKHSCV